MSAPPGIHRLIDLGMAFWGAKALQSAVQLGVFTELAKMPLNSESISKRLGLHRRSALDFLDALVALGLLKRDAGLYSNTPDADFYLDRGKPSYIGGLFELAETRLYPVWARLTEALHTGEPQNEAREENDYYADLCGDEVRLRTFLEGMTGLSLHTAEVLARKFPWEKYKTFVDIGGAMGVLAAQVALANPHLGGGSFDLPPVRPYCEQYFASLGLQDRLKCYSGNFFSDPMPEADVLVMGHVLTNWDLGKKRLLISKAYESLRAGGALVVYDPFIDEARNQNSFGFLMSLNMLLVTSGGFAYRTSECMSWMRAAGFREVYSEELTFTEGVVVGMK